MYNLKWIIMWKKAITQNVFILRFLFVLLGREALWKLATIKHMLLACSKLELIKPKAQERDLPNYNLIFIFISSFQF